MVIPLAIIYTKYQKKQILDYHEKEKLQDDVSNLSNQRIIAQRELNHLQEQTDDALQRYEEAILKSTNELNTFITEQRTIREKEFEAETTNRKSLIDNELQQYKAQADKEIQQMQQTIADASELTQQKCEEYRLLTQHEQEKLENIQQALRQQEMEKQERLFYTIQLPEEFQEDIEYLLTTVSDKVKHPDIISKLVWAEYVKPNLDNTFKRIEIKTEPGIYKLTSLANGMAYIGKSTDVKKRIADHFKSSIGIKSIADQAVHHAILKEGFWNWTIEILTYCEKERLNELEKYYIEFFKSQEFGYNKNSGGGG